MEDEEEVVLSYESAMACVTCPPQTQVRGQQENPHRGWENRGHVPQLLLQ